MQIREYAVGDREELIEMFLSEVDSSYISHGEMQMGLSNDGFRFTPDFRDIWVRYLDRQSIAEKTFINVCEDESGLIGFIIFGVDSDYHKEYGVLYDFFIKIKCRGSGFAVEIFKSALKVLNSNNIKEIYFESGASCHRAHAFYKKMGSQHISNVYRIENIEGYID